MQMCFITPEYTYCIVRLEKEKQLILLFDIYLFSAHCFLPSKPVNISQVAGYKMCLASQVRAIQGDGLLELQERTAEMEKQK